MAEFNFKNVGNKPSARKFDVSNSSKVQNIGIKTPVSNFREEEIFDMHIDPREQIKDNLKNLILTNQGERLCLSNFGANLKSLLYDYSSRDNYDTVVAESISQAVKKHIPTIQIDNIESELSQGEAKFNSNAVGMAELLVKVIYSIPILRINNQAIEVKLNIGG